MTPFFLLTLLACLPACVTQTVHNQSLTFYKPKTLIESLTHGLTKKSALQWMDPVLSPNAKQIAGSKRLQMLGEEFLLNLGGEVVKIITPSGELLEGVYLNPENYRKNHFQTLVKWKKLLQNPKNCKMGDSLEVNFEATNLPSFLSMPPFLHTIKAAKQKTRGVVCLPNFGLPYELDVKFLLNFVVRGFHVIAIHYRGIDPSLVAEDGLLAASWLKERLQIDDASLLIAGKSFGSSPAIYTAIKCPGSSLILEKPFFRMSSACDFTTTSFGKFFKNPSKQIIETYYRFPNEDWISQVTGKILLIQSYRDKTCESEESLKRLSYGEGTISHLHVQEGYFGRLYDHGLPSWYTNERNQEKLDDFLKTLEISD